MAKVSKKYVCTHQISVPNKKGDGFDVIKAGDPIKASQLTKKTIEQYLAGGILSEVKLQVQDDTNIGEQED